MITIEDMKQRLKSLRGGYTLAELLIVVAIIAIVCAIGIGGILSQIKNLRQMKLDRTAQTIYTAAQNRLTELYSSGDTAYFDALLKRDAKPSDWSEGDTSYKENDTLTIIRSDKNYTKDGSELSSEKSEALKRLIFPEGAISEELYQNNWVVEFDAKQGYVYSVFYADDSVKASVPTESFYDEPDASALSYDLSKIRSDKRSVRLNETDARVGYFMGAFSVIDRADVDKPILSILVENNAKVITGSKVTKKDIETGDELKLTFRTILPNSAKKSAKVDYLITVTGKTSGSTYTYTLNGLDVSKSSKSGAEKSIILDKLITDETVSKAAPDLSFYQNFCNNSAPDPAQTKDSSTKWITYQSRDGNMIPGEDLEITFTVSSSADSDLELKENTVSITVNSLFGNDTKVDAENGGTASISCARHLQNLDSKTSHLGESISGTKNSGTSPLSLNFTAARQRADIDFSDTDGYKMLYNGRDFTPIDNKALMSYDGACDGTEFAIRKLTAGCRPGDIKTEEVNAGLFGTFYGEALKNITLTGLKANDDNGLNIRNAGAVAAELAGSNEVTINNCKVYLQRADYTGANEHDEKYSFIKANDNAGGLIGLAGVSVSVKNSFAATTVESGLYGSAVSQTDAEAEPADSYYGKGSGGLIGWAEENVRISASYADCYLTGAYIGGLVGFIRDNSNTGSEITGSYSAGYALISEQTARSAGLAGNSVHAALSMAASYSAFDTGSNTTSANTALYSTICTLAGGAEPEAVYYLNTGAARKDIAKTALVSSAELKDNTETSPVAVMNKQLSGLSSMSGISFDNEDASDRATEAYGLKDDGWRTKIYEYPHILINGKPVMHYCDWLDKDIKSGVLVYFEKYNNGSWGFYGNGTDTLYSEAKINEDKDNRHIVTDGYAVLFSKTDYDALGTDKDTAVSVNYNNGKAAATLGSSCAVEVSAAGLAKPTDVWNQDSVFLLLPEGISNYGINGETGDNAYSGYYQRLTIDVSGSSASYDFAPHFAKAVTAEVKSTDAITKPKEDDDIYIRTPRQLYMMSLFYGTYQQDTENCRFYQELDLDYSLYDWGGDSHAPYTNLSNSSAGNAANRTQTPIADGSSDEERFIATYEGFYHTITGFSILAAEDRHYVGLFGKVDGNAVLQNIVVTAELNDNKFTAKATDQVTGNGNDAYVGLLAGYVGADSRIYNCAAASYALEGYAYGSSRIYAGGLCGYNLGAISDCSAVIPSIKIHTNENAAGYVGSFAGYNSSTGEITSCYGISYIDASTTDTSNTYGLGGFAGTNNGHIESSYCAMAYTSSNINTDNVSAFTQGIGQVDKCMYLNGGNYFYVDKVNLYNFEKDAYAAAATDTQLKGMVDGGDTSYSLGTWLSNDFGQADESINHEITTAKSKVDKYPYPAVVSDGKQKVHYGEWFFESGFANMGFIYWEHETGGSNNGYHFYIIDADGAEHSTLCEAHDDGGIIKEYGYGYYYIKDGAEPTVTWEKVNASPNSESLDSYEAAYAADSKNGTEPAGNDNKKKVWEAVKSLKATFNGAYEFVLYRTTETGVNKSSGGKLEASDYGMYLTDDSAYASCTLKTGAGSDEITRKYIFTPFFGKSMVLVGDYELKDNKDNKLADISLTDDDIKTGILGHNAGEKTDKNGAYISTDYATRLNGTSDNNKGFPFEIRSISQLQNLNWRWDKKNATSEVTEEDTEETTTTTGPVVTNTETQTIAANTKKDNTKNITNRNWTNVNIDENVISTDTSTTTSGGITTSVITEKVILAHTERQKVDESSKPWWGTYYSRVYVDEHEETIETRVTTKVTKTAGSNNYTYLRWYANGDSTYGGEVTESQGYNYYWKQTHDVNAYSKSFTPIGGLWDTKTIVSGSWDDVDNVKAIPYVAFFNGDYNGSSYKIQNVNISTESQTVGLFGMTVCAALRNIILYSSENNTIEAAAPGRNWYMQGSLVGFAGKGTIENCAVAGYKVIDNRTVGGDGDANVGGFIGFASTNITNCSVVNEIEINATHTKGKNIRVGGLAGICTGTIKNSYCGGSIKSGTTSGVTIYVAGIMGGEWFKGAGLYNLTGIESFEKSAGKINPRLENCYSYVKLPTAMTNNTFKNSDSNRIAYVKVLATTADLDDVALAVTDTKSPAANPATIKIKNCYYYKAYAGTANVERHVAKGSTYDVSYQDANGNAIADGSAASVMGLSYEEMKTGLLNKLNAGNGGFSPVTTTENGSAAINGKYSFPGSDKELQGENYPFPTIVTQTNPFYDTDMSSMGSYSESPTVHVHYGEWPKSNGLFIDKTSESIDLITSKTGKTEINTRYYADGEAVGMTAAPVLSFSNGNSSNIVSCSLTPKTDNGLTYYLLTVQALNEGYETITLTYTADGRTYSNTVDIGVTSELSIEVTALKSANSETYVGVTTSYKLTARDSAGNVLQLSASNWAAEVDTESSKKVSVEQISLENGNVIMKLKGIDAGTAYITVNTQNIYPGYGGTKPVGNRYRTLTVTVNPDPYESHTKVNAMIYVDGQRQDSEENNPVSVDFGSSVSSDSTAKSALEYWTNQVNASDTASISLGRTFTGWITEDKETFNEATKLYSNVKVMATWDCLSVSFKDKAEGASDYTELKKLSYHGSNFYTDNTLSVTADTPQPYKRSGDESFSGYWTEKNGGKQIVGSDGTLVGSLDNTGNITLYARFDVSSDELTALSEQYSSDQKAAYDAVSEELTAIAAASLSTEAYISLEETVAETTVAADLSEEAYVSADNNESTVTAVDSNGQRVDLNAPSNVIRYNAVDSETTGAADDYESY